MSQTVELTWEANHYSFHAFNASLLLPFFPLFLTDNFNIEIVNSLGHGAFSAGLSSQHLKFQWNARKESPDPETSEIYLCIPGLLGGTGAFHHHHPLLLLCLCCSFTLFSIWKVLLHLVCSSLVWRWQGWCPRKCWVTKMTSLGFLSLPPAKLTGRAAEGLQGAQAGVKRARRQHKNQMLLCYVHTQPSFFTYLQSYLRNLWEW